MGERGKRGKKEDVEKASQRDHEEGHVERIRPDTVFMVKYMQ